MQNSLAQPIAQRNARGPAPLIRYATLAGAQLFVGAAAIFARFALLGAGPLAVSYLRLGIAGAVVLSLLALRGGAARKRLPGGGELVLALAGAALAVHFAGWIASLEYTSVAIATLLVCTSPLFTGLADAIVHRRLPSRSFGLALLCGAAGLGLAIDARAASVPVTGHAVLGAFLATLGGAAMAAYLMLVQRVRRDVSTLGIIARTYSWAAVLIVPLALLAHESPPPLSATSAWLGILAMAFVSQLLGHTAINVALRWFTPTTVGFSTLFEPIVAAVLAAIVFREALGGTTLLGAVLLFAAIALAIRDQAVPAEMEL